MKRCRICHEVKELSEFRVSSDPRYRDSRCRDCEAVRLAEKARRTRELTDRIKNVPCMDCGVRYPPYVMEFDHRPDEQKLFTIGNRKIISEARLLAEIAKCDIVCANCHRVRTHTRSRDSVREVSEVPETNELTLFPAP